MLNMPGMPTWTGETPALPFRTTPGRVSDTAKKHVKEQRYRNIEKAPGEGGFGDVPGLCARGSRQADRLVRGRLTAAALAHLEGVAEAAREGYEIAQAAFVRVPCSRFLPLRFCTAW